GDAVWSDDSSSVELARSRRHDCEAARPVDRADARGHVACPGQSRPVRSDSRPGDGCTCGCTSGRFTRSAETRIIADLEVFSALGGTRTPNLLIRSQMLYPIELRALGNAQP